MVGYSTCTSILSSSMSRRRASMSRSSRVSTVVPGRAGEPACFGLGPGGQVAAWRGDAEYPLHGRVDIRVGVELAIEIDQLIRHSLRLGHEVFQAGALAGGAGIRDRFPAQLHEELY